MRRYRSALVLIAIFLIPLALAQLAPVRGALIAVLEAMRGGTGAGVALYFAAYVVGAVLTLPTWLLSGMAGYAYGPVRGVLVASPANVLGATVTFLLGRFALADRLGRRFAESERWVKIRRAVGADAFRMGILLRISPLAPQNLLGYGLSLTPMRLGTYMAATWLGMLPITCFHVYVGSLVPGVTDLVEGKRPPLGAWGWAATGAGVLVSVVAVVTVARLVQRALAQRGV